ncbi:general secretion pathway protein N [Vibrio ichthyoenteri ATCC 700023]|uniref:Type II secretion system protein N n=1 Tax=Vibrio ichthyoenteri ATCC 700023 TaxID=870968 RepID=F9S5F3_9VIBR|nr:type II secretion system protein N [Vibrio ichthyoenteri]EGU35895.1 general secretion pathway protein N [Vibrio ichthyoenteri ATCC 700023]
MKRKIALGALLLLTFIISAVVHLPIQVVLAYVPLPVQLKISQASGTLWQGQAQQVNWQRYNLGQVSWQLVPSALLSGNAEAKVRFGRGSQWQLQGRGVIGYGLKGAYAENLLAAMPVTEALKLAPALPIPLTLEGQLELNVKQLNYAAPYCAQGTGSLVWNTDVVGTPLADVQLGPVIAELSCQDNQISVKGTQQSAQVRSEFSAELMSDQRFSAKAWFIPQAAMPSALADQLQWLPKPDAQGRYQFSRQGRL